MILIPSILLAIVFLCAAAVKWTKHEYEHAFTRMLVVGFYAFLALEPNYAIEGARSLSRWFFLLLGSIEVISWFAIRRQIKGKK